MPTKTFEFFGKQGALMHWRNIVHNTTNQMGGHIKPIDEVGGEVRCAFQVALTPKQFKRLEGPYHCHTGILGNVLPNGAAMRWHDCVRYAVIPKISTR